MFKSGERGIVAKLFLGVAHCLGGVRDKKIRCGAGDEGWGWDGSTKEQTTAKDSPGPVALPHRLVSQVGRPLEGEGTRMAARKARDRGK